MKFAPLALALLLVQGTPTHEPPAPGPRAAIAGMRGIHTVSRLDFPDFRLRLTTTYVFPDRARWSLEDYDAPLPIANQFSRLGAAAYNFETNAASRELAGLDREHMLLQMELRRAALLYPDGFQWTKDAQGIPEARVFADSCCEREPIGTLRALSANERITFEARDRHGDWRDSLTVEECQEQNGRRFPRVLSVTGVNGSFRETIERLKTGIHYLDLAFRPSDRRQAKTASRPELAPLLVDVVPMTFAARPLPAGSDWKTALATAETLRAELQRTLPAAQRLDPIPTFEVSAEGQPLRCLLRLAVPVDPAPEGFERHEERLGVMLVLPELTGVAAALPRLRTEVPTGARAGVVYVRRHPERIEVCLPLIAE
jgi:hypothetical protein